MGAEGLDDTSKTHNSVSARTVDGAHGALGIASVAFAKATVRYGLFAYRRTAGEGVMLTWVAARSDSVDLEVLLSTLSIASATRSSSVKGWGLRRLGDVTLALPSDFECPDAFDFRGADWTLLITQGARRPRPWRDPFRPGDDVRVVQQSPTIERRGAEGSVREETKRTLSVSSTIVHADGTAVASAPYECVAREALVTDGSPRMVHLLGVARGSAGSTFETAWDRVTSSIQIPREER